MFLLPAMLFVAIGLVYPAIRTSFLAFQNNAGDWSLDNFVWMFTQPAAIRTLINTVLWVAARADHLDGGRARVRRVHRQVAR